MIKNVTRRQFAKGTAGAAAAAALTAGLPLSALGAIELKYGNAGPAFTSTNKFAAALFEEVSRRTGGEISAQILAGTLGGGEEALVQGMSVGTIDVYSGAFTGTREFDIFYTPYMFRDMGHAGRVANGVLRSKGAAAVEDLYEAKYLGVGRAGPWTLFLNEPIESLDDLRGRKIRAPAIEGMVKGVEFVGAEPTVISFGEMKEAISQGVVDGLVTLTDLAILVGLPEVTNFMMRGEFGLGLDKFLISRNIWDGFSPEHQDIIIGTFAEMENSFLNQPTIAKLPGIYDEWEATKGPGSVLNVDTAAAQVAMEPLNKQLSDEVYGAGTWDLIQNTES